MKADTETRFYIRTIKGIAERASSVSGDDFDQIVRQCNDILLCTEEHFTGLSPDTIKSHNYITKGAGIE